MSELKKNPDRVLSDMDIIIDRTNQINIKLSGMWCQLYDIIEKYDRSILDSNTSPYQVSCSSDDEVKEKQLRNDVMNNIEYISDKINIIDKLISTVGSII